MSIFSHIVKRKEQINGVSLFEMMLTGISKYTQTYPKNKLVSSFPFMVFHLPRIGSHIPPRLLVNLPQSPWK